MSEHEKLDVNVQFRFAELKNELAAISWAFAHMQTLSEKALVSLDRGNIELVRQILESMVRTEDSRESGRNVVAVNGLDNLVHSAVPAVQPKLNIQKRTN